MNSGIVGNAGCVWPLPMRTAVPGRSYRPAGRVFRRPQILLLNPANDNRPVSRGDCVDEAGSSVSFYLPESLVGKMVDIHIDNEYAFSSQVGKKSRIKIDKGTDNAKRLLGAFQKNKEIKIFHSK